MEQRKTILFKIKKIIEKFRYGLICLVIRDYFEKIGIVYMFFYWMKESIADNITPELSTLPDEYSFSLFDSDDIDAVRQNDSAPTRSCGECQSDSHLEFDEYFTFLQSDDD